MRCVRESKVSSQHDSNLNTSNSQRINKDEILNNTSLSEISVANFMDIINEVNKPINDKLDNIYDGYNKRMLDLEGRIQMLEAENTIKDDKIETLTEIVVNMQKGLNVIDGHTRSNNIIITGLHEDEIKISDENGKEEMLNNDKDKIKHMLTLIQCDTFTADDIGRFVIERIGKQRHGYNRAIKIKLASTKERNEFIKNAKILKSLNDPWIYVYIKKRSKYCICHRK